MSTYNPTRENATGSTDPRPNYIEIGEDNEGAHHCYATRDETIHVIQDGERTHVEVLNGRPVDDWIQYVKARRGWRTQRLYASPQAAWRACLQPLHDSLGDHS